MNMAEERERDRNREERDSERIATEVMCKTDHGLCFPCVEMPIA